MAATEGKKRKAPGSQKQRPPPNKRQKHSSKPVVQNPAVVAARKIPITKLNWKAVEIPDVLDDYEGFYGLEEVDDVEVVREGNIISYKAKEEAPLSTAIGEEHAGQSNGATSDAESWGGFSDEDDVKDIATGTLASPKKIGKSNGKQTAEKPKAPAQQQVEDDEEEEEEGEDDEDDNDKDAAPNGLDEELEDIHFAELHEEDFSNGIDTAEWASLDLPEEIQSALSRLNFARPTPIQRTAIPEINAGLDVVGKASTGSGKTLAYGIPILQAYLEQKQEQVTDGQDHFPMALIVAPTRELAVQINNHLSALYSDDVVKGPRIATVTGGLAVQKQQRLLAKADIIIGTPGRLWDVISSSRGLVGRLKRIRFLVIDEADRLLSDGHFNELEEIVSALDRTTQNDEVVGETATAPEEEEIKEAQTARLNRQTLVFSATFSKDLQHKLTSKPKRWQAPATTSDNASTTQESLAHLISKLPFRTQAADGTSLTPKIIDVDPVSAMAPGLREALIECPTPTEKDLYLYSLILLHPRVRTLVFANSISAVKRLVPFLQNLGLPVQGLHSHMAQKARLRAVERFGQDRFTVPGGAGNNTGNKGILISTDISSRGLDIPAVDLVIHYHLPRTADSYVHRSGRTARAGSKGASILICAPTEVMGMRRLVGKVHAERKRRKALRSLELDHRVVARVRDRVSLAKRIADVEGAKAAASGRSDEKDEKGSNTAATNTRGRQTTSALLRQAAEDLGVEYDSDELDAAPMGRHGRGNARRAQKKADKEVSRGEVAGWKRELKDLLSRRVNVGVSERYVASGVVDIDELMKGEGLWVGAVRGVGMDLDAED